MHSATQVQNYAPTNIVHRTFHNILATLLIPGTVFGGGYRCREGIIKEYANATIDGRTITDGIWNKVSA